MWRPKRLLVFNLAMDLDHSMLAFASSWVDALAERVESVDVLTMIAGRVRPPQNVRIHSVGKERGFGEPRRVWEFYRILRRILTTTGVDACFSHMMPLFSVLGGPVLRARGVPIVTWYAHPKVTATLKLAHHLSDRIVTSLPTTYPYRRDKVVVIGQGIDTDLFTPSGISPDTPPMILSVGRLAPVKDQVTLLDAAARLRTRGDFKFTIVLLGEAVGDEGRRYAASLRTRCEDLKVDDVVRFEPPLEPRQLPQWYQRATVHVNLTKTGSGDKVAWESMSCGRPCVAANEGFRDTFGRYAEQLLFPHGDSAALAERLASLLALSRAQYRDMGTYLREQVMGSHGLQGLADRVLEVLRECRNARGEGP